MTKYILPIASLAMLALAACDKPNGGNVRSQPTDNGPRPSAHAPHLTYKLSSTGLPRGGNWKSDPVLLDVNGDGIMDLAAAARVHTGPHIYLGDGFGTWSDSSDGLDFGGSNSCGGSLAFADINGDGNIDLAYADHCHGAFVYLSDGKSHWRNVTRALRPTEHPAKGARFTGAESIALGDFDGDKKLDMALGAADEGGIALYKGDGTGAQWTRLENTLPLEGWCMRLRMLDMNGDGKLDLVGNTENGPRVWLGDGERSVRLIDAGLPRPLIGGLYTGMSIGDVDKDGRLDICAANWSDGPEVFLQQADGSFKQTVDVFPDMKGGAVGVCLADVDLDGNLDIVTNGRKPFQSGNCHGVFILLGDGKGGFKELLDTGLPQIGLGQCWGLAVADLSGDGVPDIALTGGAITASGSVGPREPVIEEKIMVWLGKLDRAAPAPR